MGQLRLNARDFFVSGIALWAKNDPEHVRRFDTEFTYDNVTFVHAGIWTSCAFGKAVLVGMPRDPYVFVASLYAIRIAPQCVPDAKAAEAALLAEKRELEYATIAAALRRGGVSFYLNRVGDQAHRVARDLRSWRAKWFADRLLTELAGIINVVHPTPYLSVVK